MTNRTPLRTRLLRAVLTAALPAVAFGATGCKSDTSCSAVVPKAVETMIAGLGNDSMLKAEHIPKLIEGCEASKAAETHADAARCVMAAGDFAAMKACAGLDPMMKAWMKGK